MALDLTRTEILDELKRLHAFRFEAIAKATFVGCTREELLLEEGRLERISALQQMLGRIAAQKI